MKMATVKRLRLPIDQIRSDGGTQPRSMIDEAVVEDYASVAGEGILPAVVVFYDGQTYWLADGFHRLAAFVRAGLAEIDAEVRQGTQRDAVLHSVGANADHGLRRTNDDKRRAVMTLLNDSEWSQWSDNEIAKRCVVTHPFVGKLRSEIQPSCNGYKMNGNGDASDDRKATRGGKTYTVKTSNIGGGNKPEKRPSALPSEDGEPDDGQQRQAESRPPDDDEEGPDSEEEPSTIRFECPVCEREFHGEVWHCQRCQKHSLGTEARCQHCGARKGEDVASKPVPSPPPIPSGRAPSPPDKLPDIVLRISSLQSLLSDMEPFEQSFFSKLSDPHGRTAATSAENLNAIAGRLAKFLNGRYKR